MSFFPKSVQTFVSRQWETTTRLASAASLAVEFTWENRAQVASIAFSALQSSVEALRDNYMRPSEIPAQAAINTLHRVFSDPERIKQVSSLAASKMDITQIVPEEIIRRNKKETGFRSIFSNITSSKRHEIANAASLKTKAAGVAKLLFSPISALGKYSFNRTFNHYLEKFVLVHVNALHEKVISIEFMKNFTASFIDHLSRFNRFEFIDAEQNQLRSELIQKIKTIILLLDQNASKLDKCVYNLAINQLQEIIESLLKDSANNFLEHALASNSDATSSLFAYLGIDASDASQLDVETLTKFCTIFSNIMLDAFKSALDSENLDEQMLANEIATLPTNLHPIIVNVANNSVVNATEKVFKQVDFLPTIIREPLKILTLNGARQWLNRNSASDIFVRQNALTSKYAIELFKKTHTHYVDPRIKESDIRQFESHKAKIEAIYRKIFGEDQPQSDIMIEVLD